MPSNGRSKVNLRSAVLGLIAAAFAAPHGVAAAECQNQDTGITLSPGFCATVFADNLGHVRRLAVSGDNVVYANTRETTYASASYGSRQNLNGARVETLTFRTCTNTLDSNFCDRSAPEQSEVWVPISDAASAWQECVSRRRFSRLGIFEGDDICSQRKRLKRTQGPLAGAIRYATP
jgi:hypothetical protein